MSQAAAAQARAMVGCKDIAPAAVEAIAKAIEDASRPESTRAERFGNLLRCFFNLPLPGGTTICIRAYWSADAATGRKTVTSVERS